MLVKEVMTREIIAIPPDETIESAAVTMTHCGISSLIIRGERSVLGILTERDVLTRVVARGEDPRIVKVGDVMTSQLISVNPDASVDEASELMLKNRIKKLPIIDNNKPDRVLGILSLTDVALVKPHLIKEFKRLEFEEKEIHCLVRQDESQHLEFKASLRYNSRQHCLDPNLEFNCLKTVCAFLNADAFLTHEGRQHFYVRAGNGSRPFNIQDSARYMIEKWPELMTSTVDITA